MALTIILRIVLVERTFTAFTMLYDYHVRTRRYGICYPKEKHKPILLAVLVGLCAAIYGCSFIDDLQFTYVIIACLGVMLSFIPCCYDSFKGLQAWKTADATYSRLQLVKSKSSPPQIMVLWASNASNEYRPNGTDVLKLGQFEPLTDSDLTLAQNFMTHHVNTNATHDWIVNRRAIIECITGTIKGFDLKTPWEWVIWIRDSIWSSFPSMAGCLEGISLFWFVTVVLGCCAVFYAKQCNMLKADGIVQRNYECNSNWHAKNNCGHYDSKEFFESRGFDKDNWFYPCVFHWIEIFLTSWCWGPFLLLVVGNPIWLFMSRPPIASKPPNASA